MKTKQADEAVKMSSSQDAKEGSSNLKSRDLFTVVKRDGMIVPFERSRILRAIAAAFRDTKKMPIGDTFSEELSRAIEDITDSVVGETLNQASEGKRVTVESIQDLVEEKLFETGHKDVARDYIRYREEHKALREDSPKYFKVLRRDGKIARFKPIKIAKAIEKRLCLSQKIEGETPQSIIDDTNLLTYKVVENAAEICNEEKVISVEEIMDEIERQMMVEGFYIEAKGFILLRVERQAERKQKALEEAKAEKDLEEEIPADDGRAYTILKKDGTNDLVTEGQIRRTFVYASRGMEEIIDVENIVEQTFNNFYEGILENEIDISNLMAAKVKIEQDPAYAQLASRILLDVLYRETMGVPAQNKGLEKTHRAYFKKYLKLGVSLDRINPELLEYDLEKLGKALVLERDDQFEYLGLQTLYDRYFIHEKQRRLETPQIFWMRVAMGLSLNEGKNREDKAIEFYNVLSTFKFVSSTPTLFNSGTTHSQMSSCYLSTINDDLHHIFKTVADDAQLSKWAGGIGNDWTNVRATGAYIKGTNGESQGIIPFLKVANDTAVAVNQGGKRKGAMCAYLETWHLDIENFLELRKNTGDERRRTHDMNTANWVPDLFMKRVEANGSWTLFSPDTVPDLHDLYGQAFEKRYMEYEKMVEDGEIKLFKKIEAVQLWRRMLSMLFETGHPWITFKDPSNIRSPQDHVGVVHSSNLCTEILLNTSAEETAVCNLGSINLAKFVTKDGLKQAELAKTVSTAIRMLDNVIDTNFYPIPEAKNANLKHRPVGMGIMGFQDALYIQDVSYASHDAVEFADRSMEMVSYYAILSSSELAKERGTYSSYKGSKWDRGILPIDSIKILAKERGDEFVDMDDSTSMDWTPVRASVKKHGMRNSNTMAIAPTATIANITGVTQSIEPTYKHLYVKSNLSGEFTVPNPFLVKCLKERNLWDAEMIDDLKYFDGSLVEIERIPQAVKDLFPITFEIEAQWIIDCASRRQKWIDMGQSLNLYLQEPNGKALHDMYMYAWKKGLKTTYYLRCLGATQIEKSTMDINKRGLQPRWMKSKSASSKVDVIREEAPAPRVCNLDEGCESCQ